MALNRDNFLSLLRDLLPTGIAWNRAPGSDLSELLTSIAEETAQVNGRTETLAIELDPRTTSELLDDWERLLALPDPCSNPDNNSITTRRNEVLAKLTGQGSISRAYYIDLAARLGYMVTIFEYRQFLAGVSHAGDLLSNGDWVHCWLVTASAGSAKFFSAGINFAGDPLAVYSDGVLECYINKVKPAETLVFFAYV